MCPFGGNLAKFEAKSDSPVSVLCLDSWVFLTTVTIVWSHLIKCSLVCLLLSTNSKLYANIFFSNLRFLVNLPMNSNNNVCRTFFPTNQNRKMCRLCILITQMDNKQHLEDILSGIDSYWKKRLILSRSDSCSIFLPSQHGKPIMSAHYSQYSFYYVWLFSNMMHACTLETFGSKENI